MPIIHVLIAKNIDSVLCEYTEYQGNFTTIARIFLQKIKPNTRQTIQYDSYQYHYINQDNITYLCITSNFPENIQGNLNGVNNNNNDVQNQMKEESINKLTNENQEQNDLNNSIYSELDLFKNNPKFNAPEKKRNKFGEYF